VLSGRPLYANTADALLYVPSGAQRRFAEEMITRGRNTLLTGGPGSGKTTTLHMTELALRDRARPVAYVSLAPAEDVGHATVAIYRAAVVEGWLEADDELIAAGLRPDDPYAPNVLVRALGVAPAGAVFLVDDVRSEVGHALFGRLRDEVWQHDLVWGAAANIADAQGLLRPPADAFFEQRLDLDDLGEDARRELLRRRAARSDSPLSDEAIESLVQHGPSSVRALISAANQAAVSGEDPETMAIGVERRRRRAWRAGGRPATMLVAEMEHRGPVSASDEELLDALGWTRPRAVELLNLLEGAEVVHSYTERRDAPGRPRKLYELRPASAFLR
jgi:hypothetical protein